MKYSKDVYEYFDPFQGNRYIVKKVRKLIKAQSPCVCNFNGEPHEIKAGSMALAEEVTYICTDCIDKFIEEFGNLAILNFPRKETE